MNRTILKRLLVIGVSVIISTLALVAQNDVQEQRFNAVTTSVPSLHISPGARAAGMGDVGVSSTPDVSQFHLSPMACQVGKRYQTNGTHRVLQDW